MNKHNILIASVILGIVVATSGLYTYPTAEAQTSDFTTGYSDGNQQGLSDRHNHVFRIGNICLNQSNSYCNGYLSGYLDGFFSTLPVSTHTTITIHEKERGWCHGENCTKTTPTPPKPTPSPIPTPPPCKVNCTK